MAGNASKPGVSVASRTLALLGAFDAAHRRLSLTDMARRADLPVPTAYRLVNELQRWGALTRTSSGDYVIGRRLWDVGLLAPMQTGLREVASPFLHDLYGATLATVHLAVREGTNALYIERLSGHASVPVVSKIGTRLPMHATGVGKVLLAHAPEAIRTEVLAHLTRLTAHTVIHGGVLRNSTVPGPPGWVCHHCRRDDTRGLLSRGTGVPRRRCRRRAGRSSTQSQPRQVAARVSIECCCTGYFAKFGLIQTALCHYSGFKAHCFGQ